MSIVEAPPKTPGRLTALEILSTAADPSDAAGELKVEAVTAMPVPVASTTRLPDGQTNKDD